MLSYSPGWGTLPFHIGDNIPTVFVSGENVLILGGGLVGCETAEFLNAYHNKVTIVDMVDALAKEAPKRSRSILLQRLESAGTKACLSTKIKEVRPDGIVGERDGEEITLTGYTRILLALGYRGYNPLEEAARSVCNEVYVIGNASRAGDAKKAIYFGAKLGLEV